MTAHPLGVVVVGTGFGCRIHVPAAKAAGMEVVAIVGRDREKATRRAARAGVEASFGSLEEALRLPNADIVVVATPPATHAALAEEAIAADRHVLVEKPFTTTAADARRLADAAARAGVVALVGHEFRFAPQRVTMRQALLDRRVGSPRMATFIGHSGFAAPLDMRAPPWWFDVASGGGWLGASVSHLVDTIRFWLGEFESVSATLPVVSGRDPETHAEDTVSARFRLRSGCEGVVQDSAAAWGDRVELVRVAGPLGALTVENDEVKFDDADGRSTLERVGPAPVVELEPSDDLRQRFTHAEMAPAIVQASIMHDLARGKVPSYDAAPPATFADGVACIEVLDAMRRSAAASGAMTCVDLTQPTSPTLTEEVV